MDESPRFFISPHHFKEKDKMFLSTVLSLIFIISCVFTLLGPSHFNGLETEMEVKHSTGVISTNALFMRVVNRIYFVSTTVSTVGYGDISPKTSVARLLTILTQVLMLVNIIDIAVDRRQNALLN